MGDHGGRKCLKRGFHEIKKDVVREDFKLLSPLRNFMCHFSRRQQQHGLIVVLRGSFKGARCLPSTTI